MKKKIKVYIAGPLCTQKEREFLEEIDRLCKKMRIETFLPHRECGLWKEGKNVREIALGDLKGFENCDFLIANLNGFNVGAGTAWEMGYAYAKKIPVIALKTDRNPKKSIEEVSAIISGLTKITTSFRELESEIRKLIKRLG
ncbi:MAG: nucleoside 2-deoxyribosyltransferase [Nanoarchaeota archaeon]|nr:nucleoside 2-deoxyribosyltransferase [Nanoarchaeota archaeon]MBU4086939.1 nucleoside 2-deoxyribosyltransferase [Nanoarchaeota archaeon]